MSKNFYVFNRSLLKKPTNIIFFSCMLFASIGFNEKGLYPLAYSTIVSLFYELGKILLTSKRPVKINYLTVGIIVPMLAALAAVILKEIVLAFFKV